MYCVYVGVSCIYPFLYYSKKKKKKEYHSSVWLELNFLKILIHCMHVLERIYIQTRLGNTSKEQVNLQNNISAIDLLEKLENVQF